ncbi:DJ-1/PfpI family protein [Viridibacillus sp. YIM B01967]|uniref:DJ-1/PfpI family protein n=1 Tax=Viridibacillus soli TaxID=2798301 RepID=A0ABS1HAC7_9BACL|nr:DJ-1/PfpI family protein [Viridibacillus soli]MBK3496369.1 DJ-1/PfpI family protein [Viridibacillus soli]
MKKTAVLLYPQFSEYELTTALSILMQGGKPISVIALTKEGVSGEAGLTCIADETIDQVNYQDFDSLLLTGCMDIVSVVENERYIEFIQKIVNQENFVIASISSSPMLLAKAGLLKGKKYTVGLLEKDREQSGFFNDVDYVEDLVVQDGNIITARGSGFIQWGALFGKALNIEFEEAWYKD